MKIVHEWLSELVDVPQDVEHVAAEISLRGFEVASVERGVIDFEITANRPDCLSHAGIAREAAVIWGGMRSSAARVESAPGEFPVAIEANDLCPRYCAQVFDVRVGPSPDWLVRRLEAAGVRSISNIVDVTNYVMLELGQPTHAFDIERLRGGRLVIRRARTGETLRTLDGVDRTLDAEMLVIADGERPVAIGGVMGGHDSEIGSATRRIVLESAYFHPPSIRRTSKRLALRTEASTRFERGGDIGVPAVCLARAAELFAKVDAGTPVGGVVDVYPSPRSPLRLPLRADRIARVLGQAIPAGDVPRFLGPLGFEVAESGTGRWDVTVPSFRVDVTREVDLIEEVGRHYGFDRLPVTFPALASAQAAPDPRIAQVRLARHVLTAAGFSEAMTFAFIERQAALPFSHGEPAAIANPLSEKFAVLRPSLLPGLVDACAHNRRRGRKDVRLFETGSRFVVGNAGAKSPGLQGPGLQSPGVQGPDQQTPGVPRDGERRAAALAWCGAAEGPHWSAPMRPVDFFDVKGIAEQVCAAFGVTDLEFEPAESPFLVAGRAAAFRTGAQSLGLCGQIDPAVAESRGFPSGEEIYGAEIDLDALAEAARAEDLRAQPLPRFPSIVRDVSILVDEALPAGAVRGTIRATAPPTLESIVEFDRYHGKGVPEGRVSLSLRLTFRAPDRTLTDDEAQAATERIVAALREQHGAERR